MFLFSEEHGLVISTHEVNDNVIPSSNAVMAENLLRVGVHLGKTKWKEHGEAMLSNMGEDALAYPRAHSTWLRLHQQHIQGNREVVVVGPNAIQWIQILKKTPLPIQHWAASETASELPLLNFRFQEGQTLIYLLKIISALPLDTLEKQKALK